VVLKFIHPLFLPNDNHKKRFIHAMEPLLQNRFSMTTRLLNVGIYKEWGYASYEYLDGVSLESLLNNRLQTGRTFAINEIYPILRQLAVYLLESGTGDHGAICPHNILILPGNLKIMDSGILKALPPDPVARQFSQNEHGRRYTAPEILSGTGITPTSDVYSLGVILGEMLTQHNFDGHPEMFSQKDKDLPVSLDNILRSALTKNPGDRYKNAEVLLAALCEVSGLPMPVFNNRFLSGSELSSSQSEGLIQSDKTAQIIMSDVIQQHYEEVTAVTRIPTPSKISLPRPSVKTVEVSVPVPAAALEFKAQPPVQKPVLPAEPDINGTQEIDLDDLTDETPEIRREVTVNINIDEIEIEELSSTDLAVDGLKQMADKAAEISTEELLKHNKSLDGVDPRLVRAAFSNETDKKSAVSQEAIKMVKKHKESLNGIDPRFIRAAARDDVAQQPFKTEINTSSDDWRDRIATEDSVVSFLSPVQKTDSKVQGFPAKPVSTEHELLKTPPPVPFKR
jgi:serine/threonine protein kinase